ncbi:S41 family peptidase [Parvibium lacunae]|uniref:S41 family peptidase n=1 Tax=Parvibium lacunae TaxID=1888893 RepID=A0A368L1T1_9BURK|nr:S41 family peptidase [Parvibium lacunae]RCS57072.1 S41 family peptidase [Parvibium lacunae]
MSSPTLRRPFRDLALIGASLSAGVLISLGIGAWAQKDTRAPLPLEEIRQLTDVFGLIKQSYVEPVEDKKLITDAINGMVSELDPHSSYLDEKSYKELKTSISGKFGGLGIEVSMENKVVKVVSPIEGTPAFRAGIRAGDYIIRVDGAQVRGMSLQQAVDKMRGEPGTKVKLGVLRKGEEKPLEFELTRDIIKVVSVRSKLIEPGFGYVRITQFTEPTTADLARELGKLYKDGELKGLVLDLRNNPGGVLQGAVGVSAAFLPRNVLVVSSKGQLQQAQTKSYARVEDYLTREDGNLFPSDPLKNLPPAVKKVPLVILVNSGSASASEIVSGALQDYDRAKILGTPSFGKGSVQQIIPLDDKDKVAIKLTISRYYTPKDRSIQAKGINPDFYVEETPDGELFANPLREADLDGHLSNDKVTEDKKQESEKFVRNPKRTKAIEFGTAEDYQLQQALNHLKGQPVKLSTKADNTESEGAGASGTAKDKPSDKAATPDKKK